MILTILLGIIGAIIGGALWHEGGAVMGLALGCLAAVVANLKHRVMRLEQRIDSLTALRAVGSKPGRKTGAAQETEPAQPSASSPSEAPPSTRPESSASESQPPSPEPPPFALGKVRIAPNYSSEAAGKKDLRP